MKAKIPNWLTARISSRAETPQIRPGGVSRRVSSLPNELARKPAQKQAAAKLRHAKLDQAWLNSDKTNAFFARRLLGVYQTVLRSPVWLNS